MIVIGFILGIVFAVWFVKAHTDDFVNWINRMTDKIEKYNKEN
jgi:hypothetical protein